MKIYNNNFVQVQSQENLQNTTVNINLYRSLNYIFTLTFKLKNDSSKFMVLGGKGWRSGESARLLAPTSVARVQIPASTPYVIMWYVSLLLVPSPLLQELFLQVLRFSLSSKTCISKFQFDQESGGRRTTLWMCYLQIIIYLFFI